MEELIARLSMPKPESKLLTDVEWFQPLPGRQVYVAQNEIGLEHSVFYPVTTSTGYEYVVFCSKKTYDAWQKCQFVGQHFDWKYAEKNQQRFIDLYKLLTMKYYQDEGAIVDESPSIA